MPHPVVSSTEELRNLPQHCLLQGLAYKGHPSELHKTIVFMIKVKHLLVQSRNICSETIQGNSQDRETYTSCPQESFSLMGEDKNFDNKQK